VELILKVYCNTIHRNDVKPVFSVEYPGFGSVVPMALSL
jgi:hypothetical protein